MDKRMKLDKRIKWVTRKCGTCKEIYNVYITFYVPLLYKEWYISFRRIRNFYFTLFGLIRIK